MSVFWQDVPGLRLQQNSNLATPADWTTSSYSVTTAKGTNSITIASPAGNRFFRLSKPWEIQRDKEFEPPPMWSGGVNNFLLGLMRHKSPRLTMETYTDSEKVPVEVALAKLPEFGAWENGQENTGKDTGILVQAGQSVS